MTTMPTTAAMIARPGVLLRRRVARGGEHDQVGVPARRSALSSVGLRGREAVRCRRARCAVMRTGNGDRRAVPRAGRPSTSRDEPSRRWRSSRRGEDAESIETPGGAVTASEIVALRRPLVRRLERDLGLDAVLDERWLDGDVGVRRSRNDQRHRRGEQQPSHGSPRCFAITIRCSSVVPSPISSIFWSW